MAKILVLALESADLPRRVRNGGCAMAFRLRRSGLRYSPRCQEPCCASSLRVGRNAEVLSDPLQRTPAAEQKIDGFLPKVAPIGLGACLQFFLG
jgi:hypothetical protein